MSRTGGATTKAKILEVATKLFAENGFDGTSVDRIARAAGVNKALIYYHFKDKDDLVTTLFNSIMEQLADRLERAEAGAERTLSLREALREELLGLEPLKPILSVLLMESLKRRGRGDYLFRCAELAIRAEAKESGVRIPRSRQGRGQLLHEFFTGVLPMIAFVALVDGWCTYYRCDNNEALEQFLDAFERTHIASHSVDKS